MNRPQTSTGGRRFLTTPFSAATVAGSITLGMTVVVDAKRRWHTAKGRSATWHAVVMSGDDATLHAVDEDLARSGLDPRRAPDEERRARLAEREVALLASLTDSLNALGVGGPTRLVTSNDEALAEGARIAFVRLHDQGLLREAEGVTDVCPTCRVVVPGGSPDGTMPAERLTLGVSVRTKRGTVELEVDTDEPELLPGAVAVAVPPDQRIRRGWATIPIAGAVVPVVTDRNARSARFVVPAHHEADRVLAVANRLGRIEVLGPGADVVVDGPLAGRRRFAARDEARRLLLEGGHLRGGHDIDQEVRFCPWCGTVALGRHGTHWLLALDRITAEVADAVRTDLDVPRAAGAQLLEAVARAGTWCVSRPGSTGVAVPASRCGHCGHTEVAVDAEGCRRCSGPLVSDEGSLDPAFVAAVWPLVSAGWPRDDAAAANLAQESTFVTGPRTLPAAVEAMALSIRLLGGLPFSRLLIHGGLHETGSPDPPLVTPVPDLVATHGRAVARAMLLADAATPAEVADLVAALEHPERGNGHIDATDRRAVEAYESGHPAVALVALANAGAGGLLGTEMRRFAADAAPVLGVEPRGPGLSAGR